MGGVPFAGAVAAALTGLLMLGCGSSSDDSAGDTAAQSLTGTAFGMPFTARDILLVHPQTWKSADSGSTAILVSDTPNLCAQITSGKTTAPSRLAIISLQQNAVDGSVVDLTAGEFVTEGQGSPSSRYGELFLSGVDAACTYDKLFSDQSSIRVTAVGSESRPVTVSLDVHFANGDALAGAVSASASCDESAVDKYLNRNPKCN